MGMTAHWTVPAGLHRASVRLPVAPRAHRSTAAGCGARGSMLTTKATQRWPNSDCTSSSASPVPSPTAPSRSTSWTPRSRPTPSPSVRSGTNRPRRRRWAAHDLRSCTAVNGCAHRPRDRADAQPLRQRRSAGGLAGGRRDGAVHRRVRGRRLRHRRDLSGLTRALFWALIGLILFGIITIFVQIPNGALIYAVLDLVIFAGLTAFDFQRLRRSQDLRSAPLLAASILLDILNVFLLLLSLFGGSKGEIAFLRWLLRSSEPPPVTTSPRSRGGRGG